MVSRWGLPAVVFGTFVATLATGGAGARAGADAGAQDVLTPEKVSRFVSSHAPEVKACYDVALARSPGLAGRLDITWLIDVSGKASRITFGAKPPADKEFGACLTRTIAAWRFPAPTEPTDITFPFVFQSSSKDPTGAAASAPLTAPPVQRGPGWEAAQQWLTALARYDVDAVARLTSFPLRYRVVGSRRACMTDSRDAAALKRWMECLRKSKSLLAGKIAAGADIEYDAGPSPDLEKASKGLTGGEWVPAFINGDGVTFRLRLLTTSVNGSAPVVQAFVLAASFD